MSKPTHHPYIRWHYPVAVGLPLIVLNAGWIAHSEMKTGVTEVTITTLFMGVAFILFLVTLFNLLVRRIFGSGAAMNQPELMTLYAMLTMSSSVAGIGNFGFFAPFIANPFYYANESNRWAQWFPALPSWIGPRDKTILKGFYEGNATFFQAEVIRAWLFPLAAWAVFFLILLWTLLCLSAILRRRWMDEEYLTFPVVALPLEMTRDDAPLYRNRLTWLGFAIPLVLHSLNSLASLYPTLPSFPINTAKQFLDGKTFPLTGLGSVMLMVHPGAVGFGYLVNTDVLFSLWFFYAVKKLLNLVGTLFNWRDPGPNEYGDGAAEFPFTGYQSWGAWLTVGIAVICTGAPYFKAYIDRAFAGDPHGMDRGEAMTARQALFGFVSGFVALCAIVVLMGAPLWLPVVFLGIYILIMLALSRMEAETAVLSPLLAWVSPQAMLTSIVGTANLSNTELTQMATLSWFNLDYRAAAMPQQLQAFVGLRRAGIQRLSPLVGVLMLSSAVGIVSCIVWDMQLYYVNGAATGNINSYRVNMGNVPWYSLQGWLAQSKPPDFVAVVGMAIGSAVTLLLTFLRARIVGFPLSPAAYVLSTTFANELFWFDLFLAWMFKSAFLRYGGMKFYRATLPFFLGLILGDFVTGAAWSLFGALSGLTLFRTFPN
ncbi:MAG: hypothetical protein H7145_04130 [Akkermansiaceae bacterium]|nr:hypothetical protein [Armatimonadota bacterium]